MHLFWGDQIVIGFLIGWLVFKQPEWAWKLLAWIKEKLGWA